MLGSQITGAGIAGSREVWCAGQYHEKVLAGGRREGGGRGGGEVRGATFLTTCYVPAAHMSSVGAKQSHQHVKIGR